MTRLNNAPEIQYNDGLSGKHRSRTHSMYAMIVFPNVTI